MTPLPPDVQRRLVEGYREQLRLYDQAAAIFDRANTPAEKDWADELNILLSTVTQLDAAMADDKSAWHHFGPRPGEVSALVDQVAHRLTSLAQSIDRHVRVLQERRDKMLPEIDEFIQRRRMLEAYGKYGDRHPHVA
jgi:hypothetical protein